MILPKGVFYEFYNFNFVDYFNWRNSPSHQHGPCQQHQYITTATTSACWATWQ